MKLTMTTTNAVIYAKKAHATGGRDGASSRSSDGRLDRKLSLPKAPENGGNPEQSLAPIGRAVLSARRRL